MDDAADLGGISREMRAAMTIGSPPPLDVSRRELDDAYRSVLAEHHLPLGTTLENKVTWRLHRWRMLDRWQYQVDRYRLDYAWPGRLIALEADGPHHYRPDVAVKDVARMPIYVRVGG